MTPMTLSEGQRFDEAWALNEAARVCLKYSNYDLAVSLLTQAADISPTARQALLARASEAAELGVSVEALADRTRRAKSA